MPVIRDFHVQATLPSGKKPLTPCLGPRSDLGAVNKEIFLADVCSRPRFQWHLSRGVVNDYSVLRAPYCMTTWNVTLWKVSYRWKIFAI